MQEWARNDEIMNGLKYVRPGNNFVPAGNLHVMGKIDLSSTGQKYEGVNGAKAHPLYNYLKTSCPPVIDSMNVLGNKRNFFWDEIHANDVVWNYEKFFIDKRGVPRFRFRPQEWARDMQTMNVNITEKLELLLNE